MMRSLPAWSPEASPTKSNADFAAVDHDPATGVTSLRCPVCGGFELVLQGGSRRSLPEGLRLQLEASCACGVALRYTIQGDSDDRRVYVVAEPRRREGQ